MHNDDELIREIASNAAEHAMRAHSGGKTKGQQLAVWQSHFDAVLAGLMVYSEIAERRNARRRGQVSAN